MNEFARKSANNKGLPPRKYVYFSSFHCTRMTIILHVSCFMTLTTSNVLFYRILIVHFRSFNKDDDSFPVYAKINKLKKKKNRTKNKESMEDKSEDQPTWSSCKVEYTEVYIDRDGIPGKPLLRKQTPVEYSDTVPIKLPNDIQNITEEKRPKSDAPRFKIEEATEPRTSSLDKSPGGNQNLYENVPPHSSLPKKVRLQI